MVGSIRGYTVNYNFKLINFDTPRWHTLEYANWQQLDGLLLQAGIPQIRGEWAHGTLYYIGDRAFDASTSILYRCLVQHTSATGGSFADDRLANPTYWVVQEHGVPLYRGVWAPGVTYAIGDIVQYGLYSYYLANFDHHSSPAFPTDAAKWVLVFDTTAAVNEVNTSASEAAASATAAALSATNSSNSAAASASSAVDSAAQAQKLFGTSTTSNTVTAGSKSFVTQASKYFNVGKFVMVRANADPVNQWMWGQVTAYSGTALTVNSLNSSNTGATFVDWIIDVSGSQGSIGPVGPQGPQGIMGLPGPAGPGGGDMLRTANLSDVISTTAALTNIGAVAKAGDTMSGHLTLPTAPAAANAVRKDYVDAAIAAVPVSDKVLKAGDTMSGALTITGATSASMLVLKSTVDNKTKSLSMTPGGSLQIINDAHTAGILNLTDAGAMDMLSTLNVGMSGVAGTVFFGNVGGKYLNYDGTNFNLVGGALLMPSATVAQQTATRQSVYAAPFDALAYNGIQLNGSFEVDQPNIGLAYNIATGGFGANFMDGWYLSKSGTSVFTLQQVASIFAGFAKELKLTVTTAQAAIGADNIDLRHKIEGTRTAKLGWGTGGAVPLTIAFFVQSSVAGTINLTAYNSDFTSSAAASVVIAAPNAAQLCVATFPAVTTGTWLTNGGIGMQIIMTIGGAAYNIVGTVGNTFHITGLTLLPGAQAPAVAYLPQLSRSYEDELRACQRHLWMQRAGTDNLNAVGLAYSAVTAIMQLPFPQMMRTFPTFSYSALTDFGIMSSGGAATALSAVVPTIVGVAHEARLDITTAGMSVGSAALLRSLNNSAFLKFDARL